MHVFGLIDRKWWLSLHSWGVGRKIIKFIIPILRGILCTKTTCIICYKHRNVFERTHHCDFRGR